jgi:ribonuclease HIII
MRGKIDMNKIYNNLFPSLEIEDWMWLFTSLELRIISKELSDIIIKQPLIINRDNYTKKKNTTTYIEDKNNSEEILNSDFFE